VKPNLTELYTTEEILSSGADLFSLKWDGYFATYDANIDSYISSAGNVFSTPRTHVLPRSLLGNGKILGELVHKDGFQATAVVRKTRGTPDWTGVTFRPFDYIESSTEHYQFHQRQRDLRELCAEIVRYQVGHNYPTLSPIPHVPLIREDLLERMAVCKADKLEGLVFRNSRSLLTDSSHGFKWKVTSDLDGTLIATQYGKGRCRTMPGAVLVVRCRNPLTGKEMTVYVGSGMNDQQRNNPPPLGSTITFEYRGLSNEGIPQKPTFKQVR